MERRIPAPRPYVRPGAIMSRLVNPIMVRFGLVPTLLVRGRSSGRTIAVPLGKPLELEGTRYLVSGRGNTHWVRNLRAAGTGTLRTRRQSETFRAVEIVGPERTSIVKAYRARLGHSVDRYFAEIPDPADHPVFRIDPLAPANED